MTRPSASATGTGPVAPSTRSATSYTSESAETKIQDLAAQVIDQETPAAVTDGGGKVIGQLTREAVLAVLVHRPAHKASTAADTDET